MTNKKWEYMVYECSPHTDNVEEHLDVLGSKGWELVAVSVQFTTHFVWFKRLIIT